MKYKSIIQKINYIINKATTNDASLILEFITELAEYEGLKDRVVAKIENINKTLFCENPKAYSLIMKEDDLDVGFAIYFYNYSTFLCKHGIYIEDIYVREKFRGKGYGKAFFKHICQEAVNIHGASPVVTRKS